MLIRSHQLPCYVYLLNGTLQTFDNEHSKLQYRNYQYLPVVWICVTWVWVGVHVIKIITCLLILRKTIHINGSLGYVQQLGYVNYLYGGNIIIKLEQAIHANASWYRLDDCKATSSSHASTCAFLLLARKNAISCEQTVFALRACSQFSAGLEQVLITSQQVFQTMQLIPPVRMPS